jgi:oxygen-independent coproporphyrinogen III oxidase
LDDHELQQIMEHLSKHFTWNRDAEITLEANPDDINNARLQNWLQLGVNRLSVGLQSFNKEELIWMNRAHTAEESVNSIKMAQDAGFANLTIDLIYGSKFQTMKSWEQTLRTAVELNTSHISSYNLTIENKTVLGLLHSKGKEPSVDDHFSAAQFDLMSEYLQSEGFIHYEISNFAKPGRFAIHNSNYWLQKPYLGIGPSAHSFDLKTRQWNVRNNQLYMKGIENNIPDFEIEDLSAADKYNEYVLTRLRTIWGCNVEEIEKRFGEKYKEHFLVQKNKHAVYFSNSNNTYSLTKEGRAFADKLASELFFVDVALH